jgi:hypothetical protein
MATITANDYNNLRDRLNLVMGLGASGYGQVLSSSPVNSGQVFTLAMWNNLRTDLLKARQHQTGVNENANLTVVTTASVIDDDFFNQYSDFMTLISTNSRVVADNQATLTVLVNQVRSSAWNGVLTHTATLTFASSLEARYFFNAGGQIRLSASRTGTATTSKSTDWTNILSSMGTIRMNHNSTTFLTGGSGSGTAKGFYNLTTTYQTLFIKGSSIYQYTENDYNIAAKVDNATNPTAITFKIEFRDDDIGDWPKPLSPLRGPRVDESVSGTLTSTVSMFRPSGLNVSVNGPALSSSTLV